LHTATAALLSHALPKAVEDENQDKKGEKVQKNGKEVGILRRPGNDLHVLVVELLQVFVIYRLGDVGPELPNRGGLTVGGKRCLLVENTGYLLSLDFHGGDVIVVQLSYKEGVWNNLGPTKPTK
jgi:hypothetical protein